MNTTSQTTSALLLLLIATVGCGDDNLKTIESENPPGQSGLRDSELQFALADFIKPKMDSDAEIDPYLAPLICLEVTDPAAPPTSGGLPGAVLLDADGQVNIDATQPTVYFLDTQVTVQSRDHRQLTFVWLRAMDSAQAQLAQGLRVTFDSQGLLAVIEILSDSSGVRQIYVTERLERAATEAFGGPSAGKERAVELESSEAPRVVIRMVISDGAQPMGPFVYQGFAANDVAALHCRCSPSQFENLRHTIEYAFAPLEDLLLVLPDVLTFEAPGWIERALRLPADF